MDSRSSRSKERALAKGRDCLSHSWQVSGEVLSRRIEPYDSVFQISCRRAAFASNPTDSSIPLAAARGDKNIVTPE
jgi:hypothetical protein